MQHTESRLLTEIRDQTQVFPRTNDRVNHRKIIALAQNCVSLFPSAYVCDQAGLGAHFEKPID